MANFSDTEQGITGTHLWHLGMPKTLTAPVIGKVITATSQLKLEPYQLAV